MKRIGVAALVGLILVMGCATHLTREQHRVLAEILEILNTTISETEAALNRRADPTSPVNEFADTLESIRTHIRKVQAGEIPYDPALMERYSDQVAGIRMNVRNPVDRVVGVDVFFEPGRYRISELSSEGKSVLDDFAADLIDTQVEPLRAAFPDKPLSVVIKAVGHADEIPLSPRFADALAQDMRVGIPDDPEARRKFLNRELSFRRARSIAEYVVTEIKERVDSERVTVAPPIIFGLGEALPYPESALETPYVPRDKRRRICKIHGNVLMTEPSEEPGENP